jgi:tetratricopeptide (TPR) repeat protein
LNKNLKHKMKQDELVTGFESARAAFDTHADEIKIGAVIVLVLAVGGFALQHFRSQRAADANEALSAALQTFRAPVATETGGQAPEPGSGPTFPTAAEKYTKALTDLQGVARRYPSLPVGVRARYYAALAEIELGQNEDAEKELKAISVLHDGLEPDLAKLALADLQRRMGQVDRAAEAYKQMASDPSFSLPRDQALMRLARLYEDARRPQDAQATYRELIEKYPESESVNDARQRVEYLQARG